MDKWLDYLKKENLELNLLNKITSILNLEKDVNVKNKIFNKNKRKNIQFQIKIPKIFNHHKIGKNIVSIDFDWSFLLT